MGSPEDVDRLVKEASATIKSDARGAVSKLEAAYALALGDAALSAKVAEELARGWARRKSKSKSLHFASKAVELAPEAKSSWTTLAKTCELLATRVDGPTKRARAKALYRAAAAAFTKAAEMTKDREDKSWLTELARDAARQAK